MSNLRARLISGVLAGVIVIAATLLHPLTFCALLAAACVIGWKEWQHLSPPSLLFGLPYLLLPAVAMGWLRLEHGAEAILALFALVWTTDIAAYAFGRLIGGPKIAPSISPNKTWAGLLGAICATAAAGYGLASLTPLHNPWTGAVLGAMLAVVAQAGDFFESWLKRRAGVKDSGRLLPGHGGLLDRIDGLLFAAPVFAAFVAFVFPA